MTHNEIGWRVIGIRMPALLVLIGLCVLTGPSDLLPTILAQSHPPIDIRHRRGSTVTSSNWSGYAVTGASGSVSDAKGTWTVPAIQGTCPAQNQYASMWVGIDGYNSKTVEQIGTDSDCQSGVPTYYAWYEFYPHWAYTINAVPIRSGDVVTAEVKYNTSSRQFTVSITNLTTAKSFSISSKAAQADRSSAEWIVEAPWSGGVLPLANFWRTFFGDATNLNTATLNGSTRVIGAYADANRFQITMEDGNGAPKAIPSDLAADGSSFTDDWISAGP